MMKYLSLPFFNQLEAAENILLAGAGGGYDVFTGLPLYFGLKAAGKQVHLANVSFSYLPFTKTRQLSPHMVKITAATLSRFVNSRPGYYFYFPEFYLSEWFQIQQGEKVPVYCLKKTGVKPLLRSYQALVDALSIDTIILVDGGTDSLMRGDEVGLGTPAEDIASIVAANELGIERKMLTCLGFGVDYFHGICHAQFLEAVADITQQGGYLGLFSLTQEMPEVQQYQAISEYVFDKMPRHISIVSSSVLSALNGHYGDYHATPRTQGSQLWINPLMPVYWCFQLPQVAHRILYFDAMRETETLDDVVAVIRAFRNECKTIRKWETMPV